MSRIKFTTIIFDIGDVLFSWSPSTKTSISPKTLRKILSCPTWFDFERGQLSEDDCYERVGAEFNLTSAEIRQAFIEARASLQSNDDLIALIRELKDNSHGTLRVFAMSNISLPDYQVLRTKPVDWSIFDQIFTSGAAGERKPNLGFYKYVLAHAGVDPRRAIFVDDKHENVLSARSLGFHGIRFTSSAEVKRALRNLVGDPVTRGRKFLGANAGQLESVTDTGIVVQENFAQLLILELTNDRTLVNIVEHSKTWNFFRGKGQLTTEKFPFDLDTTSLGLTVMKRDKGTASSVMDQMLEFVDSDGIVQTYFDHRRPRFDPVVCVNVLTLFYTYSRGSELHRTLEWVHEVLDNRAYLQGTRYYETAECFLYFISRLLASSVGDQELHALLKPLLKERVKERIGTEGDALAIAMRLAVCNYVGLRDDVDLLTLLQMQCEDGGWPEGWIYKYGSSDIKIGNRGLTTAMAIRAVELMVQPASSPSSPSSTSAHTPLSIEREGPQHKRHRRGSSLRNSMQMLWQGAASNSAASPVAVAVGESYSVQKRRSLHRGSSLGDSLRWLLHSGCRD